METKPKKMDLRVKKTKRLIRNAVAGLMKEKDIDAITVKEVAETADINRKTFYNYYANVGQVVDEIENEVVASLAQVMEETDLKAVLQNPSRLFQHLVEVLNLDPDLYGSLMQMKGNGRLVSKMAEDVKDKARGSYAGQVNLSRERLDYLLEYEFTGMFSAFRKWYSSDRTMPLEVVSQDIGMAAVRGFSGFVEES